VSYPKIIYTETDEAPMLATYSLYPILKAFSKHCNIDIIKEDISLSGRIISSFPENLSENQKIKDSLKELGELVHLKNTNIIKLPNISASIPQLQDAIQELQNKNYDIPNYPVDPKSEKDKKIKNKYDKIIGSAVNPVLREGNSDRRVAKAVKNYAKNHPHKIGPWSNESKTHVSHMQEYDFYGNEKSIISEEHCKFKIEFTSDKGIKTILKDSINIEEKEVVDISIMNMQSLKNFFQKNIQDAKERNLLLSLHLKATMMKISDPIIFGCAVETYYESIFIKYKDLFSKLNINPNNGISEVYNKIRNLDSSKELEIKKNILEIYKNNPKLAMVDSDNGITNLHVPNDIIIDASMPALIRNSGKMWGEDGLEYDTKALIPDRSYASIYQEVINFCKKHGSFDPTTMGSVSNIGLMAKKAEEYGSHDNTFQIKDNGTIRVIKNNNEIIFENKVNTKDIWRMCQTKNIAIENWIEISKERADSNKNEVIFWLDQNRAHDNNLIKILQKNLESTNLKNNNIKIMSPRDAMIYSLHTIKKGNDIVASTGNVLRDYLTDLFPILELGTSAKMLSIIPLLSGGFLYETGAGGSAPKHVQQFVKENHLRWDSLGEILALEVCFENIAQKSNDSKIKVFAEAISKANIKFLKENKSPSRKVNEIDNRGSHFYFTMYLSKELSTQNKDLNIKKIFQKVSTDLEKNEDIINKELTSIQGNKININGYFKPDPDLISKEMRPSKTLNSIIENI